ncbi:MFS transporter [Actinomadura logoneensis]|uniref:MFS transporter n=1 Tax=Actinomadura logoneensis TaxID=2293572 RepID=A0A372JLH4_9ACTN|nr:MFS transporter [Actinomadura logoneensis]RFU40694.1 MFS transporter [Actinomadura logoneensis]
MRTRSSTPALVTLALGYFTLGTASLAVVGLGAPIAADLHVRPATIGTLVTVFSLVFALAAPLTAVALGRMDRRRVLLIGLALMLAGGLGSALAPTFATLVAARVVAGLGAAVFGPVASATGSMIVPAEQRPRALAVVFGGMTAATVLGVPLASAAGTTVGWRWTLAAVAVLTAAVMALLAGSLPPVAAGPAPTARGFVRTLRAPGVVPIISTTLLVLTAQFTVYGVAGAYLAARFGAATGMVSLTLLVFGAVGMVGNAVGPRLYTRLGGARTIAAALAGLIATFAALTAAPGVLPAGIGVFAFWAFFNTVFMAPQQTRLVELLPEQRGVLLALNASALYLGMSLGSLLGSGLLPALGARGLSALPLLPLTLAVGAHMLSTRSTGRPSPLGTHAPTSSAASVETSAKTPLEPSAKAPVGTSAATHH